MINPVFRGFLLTVSLLAVAACATPELRGTGDLGLIVERASGRVAVFESTPPRVLATVAGLGDLSHATAVFSRDQRFAFVFGRDGGLTKVDLLAGKIEIGRAHV